MIRPTIPEDTPALLAITQGTELFLPADLEALRSVLHDYHHSEYSEEHCSVTYEQDGQVIGFAYYAPAAMTDRTWYLWWIVVNKQIQARGVGGEMLRYVEDDIRAQQGRLLLLETSSLPSYELTRRFYLKKKYDVLAILNDYYADGHDMVVFRKRLVSA
jgi:ribosomal protein S18 acetylase RimI-like enzyme